MFGSLIISKFLNIKTISITILVLIIGFGLYSAYNKWHIEPINNRDKTIIILRNDINILNNTIISLGNQIVVLDTNVSNLKTEIVKIKNKCKISIHNVSVEDAERELKKELDEINITSTIDLNNIIF